MLETSAALTIAQHEAHETIKHTLTGYNHITTHSQSSNYSTRVRSLNALFLGVLPQRHQLNALAITLTLTGI